MTTKTKPKARRIASAGKRRGPAEARARFAPPTKLAERFPIGPASRDPFIECSRCGIGSPSTEWLLGCPECVAFDARQLSLPFGDNRR